MVFFDDVRVRLGNHGRQAQKPVQFVFVHDHGIGRHICERGIDLVQPLPVLSLAEPGLVGHFVGGLLVLCRNPFLLPQKTGHIRAVRESGENRHGQ